MRTNAAILCLSIASASASDNTIRLSSSFTPLPTAPTHAASADLNADARDDILLFTGATLGVYSSDPDARFRPGPTTALPVAVTAAIAPVIADINADGHPDILLLDRANSLVRILVNNADLSFTPTATVPTATLPSALGLSDLDLDGLPDLLVAGSGQSAVHTNLSGGAFAPAQLFASQATNPRHILAADLRAKGPEIAITENAIARMYRPGPDGYAFAGQVNVVGTPVSAIATEALNNGLPQFVFTQPQSTALTIVRPFGVSQYAVTNLANNSRPLQVTNAVFGDLSGNGQPDVLHGFSGNDLLSPRYKVASNAFYFESEPPIGRFADLRHPLIADTDADGRNEIIAIGTNPPGIVVFHRDITNTFIPNGQIIPLDAADYDQLMPIEPDPAGRPTYIAIRPSAAPLRRTTLVPDTVGFRVLQQPVLGSVGDNAISWARADFNGDGLPDLARVTGPSNPRLRWQLGTADAGLSLTLERTIGRPRSDLFAADLNLDGFDDLVWSDGASGYAAFGRPTGFITTPVPIDLGELFRFGALAVVDVDADGRADLVYTDRPAGETARLHIATGRGDGTFNPPSIQPTTNAAGLDAPRQIRFADLNRDGRTDIILSGVPAAFHLTGPNAEPGPAVFLDGINAVDIRLADMNGDRRQDLIVLHATHATVLASTADQPFSVRSDFYRPIGAVDTALADYNLDGLPDLISLTPEGLAIIPNLSTPACPADINNDGQTNTFDIAEFIRLFNLGSSVADINGDGSVDFFDLTRFLQLFNQGCP